MFSSFDLTGSATATRSCRHPCRRPSPGRCTPRAQVDDGRERPRVRVHLWTRRRARRARTLHPVPRTWNDDRADQARDATRKTIPDEAPRPRTTPRGRPTSRPRVPWTARPWVDPAARAEAGKAARKRVPRVSHAAFEPRARPRPDRDPRGPGGGSAPGPRAAAPRADGRVGVRLLPRHAGGHGVRPRRRPRGPTSSSRPAATPTSRNFGLFASPERTLVFDANDFDETLPGPWEWDVKRLAASVVIAGRANGFTRRPDPRRRRWPRVRGYRQWMARYAGMRLHRRLVRLDHRRRHPRGGRGDRAASRAAPAPPAARGLEAIFTQGPPARRDARVRVADRRSWTGAGSSSRTRPSSRTSTSRAARRPSRRSSPTTGRRCPRTGATSSSATASSTSPSRSSASAASGPAAS